MSAERLPTDRLIGDVLAGRYQILHRLGEGAMGAVYKARHVKVGRPFAVKVLHKRVFEDPKVVQRFEREAELAGRLRHANVVGVVDVGEIDGMRYMVMDFAEGPDLAQLLDEAPMPPARIIHLVRQLLEGLFHAHERGLIHRDFKPENVIVERDSHGAELPRIVDFGIAILRDGGEGTDQPGRLTTNGLVLGTPHYMAPEQAVADPIDHRIDLFALGIVIYEMLSGRLPYDGTGAEVARANLLLEPPPIVQRVPYLEVDPLLEAFARRLMAKKRDARPPTAKAARELLDLIERDRSAAAAALGLPVGLAQRKAAVTQPVVPHVQTPGAMGMATAAPWSSDAATTSMRSPGALPVRPDVSIAPPMVYSPSINPGSPGAPFDPGAPLESRDVDTSRRIPLGWQAVPTARRRTPWLVLGAAGAGGIAIALVLLRAGAPEPAETVVMTGPSGARGDTPEVVSARNGGARDGRNEMTGPSGARGDTPEVVSARNGGARDGRETMTSTVPEPAAKPSAEPAAPVVAAAPAVVASPSAPSLDVAASAAAPRAERVSASSTTVDGGADATHKGRAPDRGAASGAQAPRAGASAAAVTDERRPTARTIARIDAAIAEPRTDERGDGARTAASPAKPDARAAAKVDPKSDRKIDVKAEADPKAATKAPRVVGLTANELSDFYSSVGRELSVLPRASAQDLWSRLLLIKIQELMAAPQARRDEAARQLLLIHQEALLRKP